MPSQNPCGRECAKAPWDPNVPRLSLKFLEELATLINRHARNEHELKIVLQLHHVLQPWLLDQYPEALRYPGRGARVIRRGGTDGR